VPGINDVAERQRLLQARGRACAPPAYEAICPATASLALPTASPASNCRPTSNPIDPAVWPGSSTMRISEASSTRSRPAEAAASQRADGVFGGSPIASRCRGIQFVPMHENLGVIEQVGIRRVIPVQVRQHHLGHRPRIDAGTAQTPLQDRR